MLIAKPDGPDRYQVYARTIRIGFIHRHLTGGFNNGNWFWALHTVNDAQPADMGGHCESFEQAKVAMRARWGRWLADAGLMVDPAPKAKSPATP